MRKFIEDCRKWMGLDRNPPEPRVPAPTGGLYERLAALPAPSGCAGARLALCRARAEGGGEDSYIAFENADRAFAGVFDGCGGSGAKVYASLGGHTGAWAASRALTLYFGEACAALPADADADADLLHSWADAALAECKAAAQAEASALLGSLQREFPSTMAVFHARPGQSYADFFWCGDSRGYVLDGGGLHQVTTDDSAVTDAMRGLREDAPMTNVASASQPYRVHARRAALDGPSALLAATDGCFGYLPSPMAFERLLLETLAAASDPEDWRGRLEARLARAAGDDFTLVARWDGFGDFGELRRALGGRLRVLNEKYPPTDSEAALLEQWDAYRAGYERLTDAGAVE